MTLVWKRTGSHEMSTLCARYKVRKFIPENTPYGAKEWRYQCWVKRLYYTELGPCLKSFAQAQGVCEKHFGDTQERIAA